MDPLAFVLRSSVLIAAGLLAAAALRRQSAALRHRVLTAALLAVVVGLPLSAGLPTWSVALPARMSAPLPQTDNSGRATLFYHVVESRNRFAGEGLIAGLWIAGTALAGAPLLLGLWRVRQFSRRAAVIDDPLWLGILATISRQYGVTRRIALRRAEGANILATWGDVRPTVLVPGGSVHWSAERIRLVLSHELAHVRRHDWLWQMCAEALCGALWFNPLVWLLCSRLRRESEQACDDEVLASGIGPRVYASELLALARQSRRLGWSSAVPMAHSSTLERRISAMLNPKVDRRVPSRLITGVVAALSICVAWTVPTVRAGQAQPAPLTGTIYDPTGAIIPGAKITLTGADQVSATVMSNASGRFELPGIESGKYQMEVTLPGFRTFRHDLDLRLSGDWNQAITLQVGELKETITIRESRTSGSVPVTRSDSGAIRVGGNIRAPRKVRDVKPVYPASMREAGLTGVVPLEAIIGKDGSVSSVRVLSAQIHPDFAIAAVDAVRQWKFQPTLLNGDPVEVVMTVTVKFDLD